MFDLVKPTNTLSSMSFDIFKIDGIEDPNINMDNLATIDLEENYCVLANNFIKECNREMVDNKISLYKAISESTEEYIVLESFSTFFSKINAIIEKALNFILSLIERFSTLLWKLIDSNKYIIKKEKEFDKFDDVIDSFSFNGYKYTFSDNIPSINAAAEFNKDLFQDMYDSTGGIISMDSVSKFNTYSTVNNRNKYDEFRGKCLNSSTSISETEFDSVLFKVFRNAKLDTEDFTVDKKMVKECITRFKDYKNIKSKLNQEKSKVKKDYDKVKQQVKEITKTNGNLNANTFMSKFPDGVSNIETKDGYIPAALMAQIDIYIKNKTEQITEFSNIHIKAFSAKLEAMKEAIVQDRTLLYTALLRIERSTVERERGMK